MRDCVDGEGEVHARYLLSATNYLTNISSNALRCHWNTLFSDVMHMKKLVLVKGAKTGKNNCEYCLTPWRCGLYSVKVMPKAKRGKKLRTILRKVKEEKELATVQKNLAEVLHSGPTVIVNCKICHKSSKFKVSADPQPEKVEAVEEVCTLPPDIDMAKKMKLKREKQKKSKLRRKRRKKALAGLNPIIMEQIHGSKEHENAVGNENEINKTPDVGDDDVIIIDEIVETPNVIEDKSRKRKIDDDIIMEILGPAPEKIIKMNEEKDVILANPLNVTPLGLDSKQCKEYKARNDDFISLDTSYSTPQRNKKSKGLHHNQEKQKQKDQKALQAVSTQKQHGGNKKNLNRWKKLIAEENAKPTKTSSLQDFLLTL